MRISDWSSDVCSSDLAAYTGALWFREVIKQAQLEVPQADASSILDCADKPGLVMAAFRQGVLRVRFTGPAEATERLQAMADAESLHLLTGPLEALDLPAVKDKAARSAARRVGKEGVGKCRFRW